jgi:hypothetical protein
VVQGTDLENTRSKSRPFLCRIDQSGFQVRLRLAMPARGARNRRLPRSWVQIGANSARKNDAQAGVSLSQEKVQQGVSYRLDGVEILAVRVEIVEGRAN